jgi:hypothetical protein
LWIEVAEVAEKERGGSQEGLRFLVVEAEEDQQIDHEVEEEVPKAPNCCWKATVRRQQMCD